MVEFAEGLPVVGADAHHGVRVSDSVEGGQLVAQVIAAGFLKGIEKPGGPIRAIVFEGIMELGARFRRGESFEGAVEGGEVGIHRRR